MDKKTPKNSANGIGIFSQVLKTQKQSSNEDMLDSANLYADLYTKYTSQTQAQKKKPFFLKQWCLNLIQSNKLLVSYVNEKPDYWQGVQQKRHQDEKIKLSLGEDDIATYYKTDLVKEIDYNLSLGEQSGKALNKNHRLTGIFSGLATLMPVNAIVWVAAAFLSHDWTLKGIVEIWAVLATLNTVAVLSVLHNTWHFSWCEKLLEIIPLFKRYQTDYTTAGLQLKSLLDSEQAQHEYLTYVDLKLKSYDNLAESWLKKKGTTHTDYMQEAIFLSFIESTNNGKTNMQDELKTLLDINYVIRSKKESVIQAWSQKDYETVARNMNELMHRFEQTDNWLTKTQKAGLKFENEQKFKQSHEQYKENHLLSEYLKERDKDKPQSTIGTQDNDKTHHDAQVKKDKEADLDNDNIKKML